MPREKHGKWFMLRVTDRQGDRRGPYLDKLLKKIETYACYETGHKDENHHYHSIHQRQLSTLKDRFAVLQWCGNENHAISHLIEDTEDHWRRCLCYISKGPERGTYPVIVRNDFAFTEDQIWSMHYEWWDKWEKMKYEKIKAEKKERNLFNEMYEFVPQASFREGPWAIASDVIQFYQNKNKLEPNDFQIKCYIKSLIRRDCYERRSSEWERFKRCRAKEIVGNEFTYEFLHVPQFRRIRRDLDLISTYRGGDDELDESCAPPAPIGAVVDGA